MTSAPDRLAFDFEQLIARAIGSRAGYLYWKPDLAAERLITDITSKGIFS